MRPIAHFRRRLAELASLRERFGDLIVAERGLLFVGALALTGEILCQLIAPFSMMYIVDGLLIPQSRRLFPFPEGYAAEHPERFLVAVCLAVVAIAAVGGLLAYVRAISTATAGQRMVMKLRKRLYAHLHALSLRFHQGNRLGDLLMRITGDIPMLREVLSGAILELAGRIVLVISTFALLLAIDAPLALASAAVLIAVGALSMLFSRRILKVAKKQREQEGVLANTANETLAALVLVKALGREDEVVRRFARQNRTSMRQGLKGTRLQASLSRWVEIVFAIGVAAVLLFGVHRVQSGAMTPGMLVSFLTLVRSINKPLRRASRITAQIGKAAACGERIVEVLRIAPEEVDAPDAIPAPPLKGEIEFRGVSFSYDGVGEDERLGMREEEEEEAISAEEDDEEFEAGDRLGDGDAGGTGPRALDSIPLSSRRSALRGIDLHFAAGERIAIVGRNGAGKSTLMHLLLRFYEPTVGEILFDGVPAGRYTIRSVRDRISIALQGTILFGSSVRENLRFYAPEADDAAMERALDRVGAHFVKELPEGLATELAEGGSDLSGGQRRKLTLAGSLLRDAPILILDEPTSSIDPASRDDLLRRLPEAIAGRTTLIITHDPSLLGLIDRVVHLEDGCIAGEGAHEALRARSPAYRALLREGVAGEGALR